jgi:hypothetical protein
MHAIHVESYFAEFYIMLCTGCFDRVIVSARHTVSKNYPNNYLQRDKSAIRLRTDRFKFMAGDSHGSTPIESSTACVSKSTDGKKSTATGDVTVCYRVRISFCGSRWATGWWWRDAIA